MLLPLKVSEVAQMNGCLPLHSYVNVYPISDSSEAVGHFILSAWPWLSPHAGSEVQPPPQGSHHILATSWFSELHGETRPVRTDTAKKTKKKQQWWNTGLEPEPVRPTEPPPGSQARRPGLMELILKTVHWSRARLPASSQRSNWLFWKMMKLGHN